jgi:hypothetical protein
MLALLYIVGYMLVALMVVAILWSIWPPLAGGFVGYLYFREFGR